MLLSCKYRQISRIVEVIPDFHIDRAIIKVVIRVLFCNIFIVGLRSRPNNFSNRGALENVINTCVYRGFQMEL